MIARRTFIKRASMLALAASTSRLSVRDGFAQQVPNSSGSEPATLKAPPGACDCHHHIYDAVRFPPATPGGRLIPDARLEEFRLLQRRIGTTRNIVVTPSAYVTDNRVTLDAIAKLGANARGVAVIHPSISEAELKVLTDGGIRGIRFSITDPATAATTVDMIEPLSKRVNALGWHVQINMGPDQIVANEALWSRLPTPIVFDHMGHVPQPAGLSHPVYGVIRRLVDKGRTWVKLSVTYDNTADGTPGYADITKNRNEGVTAGRGGFTACGCHPCSGISSRRRSTSCFQSTEVLRSVPRADAAGARRSRRRRPGQGTGTSRASATRTFPDS